MLQTQGVRADSQRRTWSKTVVMLAHPSKQVQEAGALDSTGRKDPAGNKNDGDKLHSSLNNGHDAVSTSHSKGKGPTSKDSSASATSKGHGVVGRMPIKIPGIPWEGSWNVVSGAGNTTSPGHATNGTKPQLNGSEVRDRSFGLVASC